MKSALLNLQSISKKVSLTQNILSTGKKVNSALDNPSSFYTATSLKNRAGDLNALLDSMGQVVFTIKAATTGLEKGVSILETAAAFAVNTLNSGGIADATPDAGIATASLTPTTDFSDYTKVTNETELREAINNGTQKIILGADITLNDTGLTITETGIVIEGNGKTLTFNGSNDAVIHVNGGQVQITNLSIVSSGENVYGIHVTNVLTDPDNQDYTVLKTAKLEIDNAEGFNLTGVGARDILNGDFTIHDGKGNTEAMVAAHENNTKDPLSNYAVFEAVNNYAVADAGDEFGEGTWYVPSIGEMMQIYGYTASNVSGTATSGRYNKNLTNINNTLSEIGTAVSGEYWTSTELNQYNSWKFNTTTAYRNLYEKSNSLPVRAFQFLENAFNPLDYATEQRPKIGNIYYNDGTWGDVDGHTKATEEDNKVAVGVITNVSGSGDITIMSLDNVVVSEDTKKYKWGGWGTDQSDIDNIGANELTRRIRLEGEVKVTNTPFTIEPGSGEEPDGGEIPDSGETGGNDGNEGAGGNDGNEGAGGDTESSGGGMIPAESTSQYAKIISQYDTLIKEVSYKGVNLLQNDNITVNFNENRTSKLVIYGKDASSAKLGLTTLDWQSTEDVVTAIKEISSAMTQIRTMLTDLGTAYSVVSIRQDFTENLINILTEGADKLTLADMNEESAKMLSLQTRQQLAVNALSLASEASKGILSFF